MQHLTPIIYFNSTIVRLKVFHSLWKSASSLVFQFYNSSIKSRERRNCDAISSDFNSTIVRLKDHSAISLFNRSIHFNSTIVRLKGTSSSSSHIDVSYFNSTIVRLKAQYRSNRHDIWIYFNSTIVRLKDVSELLFAIARTLFQFYNSSIKRKNMK